VLGEEFVPKDEIFVAFRKVAWVHVGGSKQGETVGKKEADGSGEKENKKKRRVNDRTIL
jgi:hypothetical protein